MKKLVQFLTLTVCLCIPWLTQAQGLSNYGFKTGIDATKWVDMTSSTQIPTPYGVDSYASSVEEIGFPFLFGGQTYTQFSVNTDGNLKLGSEVTGTSAYYPPFSLSNSSNNNPKTNGFGCDGYGVSGVHYVKKLVSSNKKRNFLREKRG